MSDPRNGTECVTSSNLLYWRKYGSRMATSFLAFAPAAIRLRLYCEASQEGQSLDAYISLSDRVARFDLYKEIPALSIFLTEARGRMSRKMGTVFTDPDSRLPERGYDYKWDAMTFGLKAFSIIHALRTSKARFLFWIDADTVFRSPMPENLLESLFMGQDVVYFGRSFPHSETGFIGFDLATSRTEEFTKAYAALWEKGIIFSLPGWTDSHGFDHALRETKSCFGLRARNLSTCEKGHVIAYSPLAQYLDHQKGPRKRQGFSPEHR